MNSYKNLHILKNPLTLEDYLYIGYNFGNVISKNKLLVILKKEDDSETNENLMFKKNQILPYWSYV